MTRASPPDWRALLERVVRDVRRTHGSNISRVGCSVCNVLKEAEAALARPATEEAAPDRCPNCSFQPESRSDFCAIHRPPRKPQPPRKRAAGRKQRRK